MLRSTLIVMATVALALPVAAQAFATVPVELITLDFYPLDTATETPLPVTNHHLALGSAVRFEALAPRSGDLLMFAALLDNAGQPMMGSVVPLWSTTVVEGDTASLQVTIPLGFPEIDIGVQAVFIENTSVTHVSGLHRLGMFSLN